MVSYEQKLALIELKIESVEGAWGAESVER
jgi:hypothetical protein